MLIQIFSRYSSQIPLCPTDAFPFPRTFLFRILLFMLHSASTLGASPAPRDMTETANPELPPSHTHKPKASHESCGLSLPAIFLFCQCHSCDSDTWFVCVSHHRQLSWHRKTPFHHEKGARRDSKAATNSISHSSLKASHSHPKPGTLLTCFPI